MPNKGTKMSEEHKRKISIAHKGMKKPWSKGKQNIGKIHSKEWKKKISDLMKVENKRRIENGKHNWWKGGITPENQRIRHSLEYGLWRTAVFERDNYTCIWCGTRSGNGKTVVLNADHIKSFALFPELRFAIDNGRTLCEPCHITTDTFAGRGHKRRKNQAVIK